MTGRFRSHRRSRAAVVLATFGAVLLAGLLAWAALLVIPACGIDFGPLGRLDACPHPDAVSAELVAEVENQAHLRDRVNSLQRRLATLPDCPLPEPLPDTQGLDADRWQEGDISLLEGCWSLASDYSFQHVDTGEITDVASWEMCFDGHGRGNQDLVFSDGATCSEPVAAVFLENGRLRIDDQGDVACSDSTFIFRRTITCHLEPGGEAACQSRQPERGDTVSDVRIVRRTSP